jgi:hypothetical protein
MNKGGQIKAPPSVGVHVVGFIAYSDHEVRIMAAKDD